MRRQINIFDKVTEEYIKSLDLENCDDELKKHYQSILLEDPNLIYEYEIEEKDVDFFEKLIEIDIIIFFLALNNSVLMIHTKGIIYGETVTAAIENGVLQTVYGAVIVTAEMLK